TFIDWLAQSMRLLPRSASSTFLMSHAICVGVVAIPLLCARFLIISSGDQTGYSPRRHGELQDIFARCLCDSVVDLLYLCAPCSAGSLTPASLASLAALSVASQVKSLSLRPKWP